MAPLKKQITIEGAKIVKHTPPSAFKFSDKDKLFRIKTSSPFMSCVKQISKKLSNIEKNIKLSYKRNKGNNTINNQFITILGLQRVIPKVLLVANYFRQRGHKIEIRTMSVTTLDEFTKNESVESTKTNGSYNEDDESDEESIMRKRALSGLQIDIYI